MRAKELTIVFFALMLSIAAFASEKQQRVGLRNYSDDVMLHEAHEIHIVREEVNVTN